VPNIGRLGSAISASATASGFVMSATWGSGTCRGWLNLHTCSSTRYASSRTRQHSAVSNCGTETAYDDGDSWRTEMIRSTSLFTPVNRSYEITYDESHRSEIAYRLILRGNRGSRPPFESAQMTQTVPNGCIVQCLCKLCSPLQYLSSVFWCWMMILIWLVHTVSIWSKAVRLHHANLVDWWWWWWAVNSI